MHCKAVDADSYLCFKLTHNILVYTGSSRPCQYFSTTAAITLCYKVGSPSLVLFWWYLTLFGNTFSYKHRTELTTV